MLEENLRPSQAGQVAQNLETTCSSGQAWGSLEDQPGRAAPCRSQDGGGVLPETSRGCAGFTWPQGVELTPDHVREALSTRWQVCS
jgi:hypothetical protein